MRKSYPIPDDYDDKWECVSIEWPSSIKWRGILVGLLYSMSRGRSWDERTGRITDVQTIGREIFDRNYPLSACCSNDGGGNGGGGDNSSTYFGDYSWCCLDVENCEDCEENDMNSCCLSDKIRIENGILQVLDCGKWVDVGGVGAVTDQSQDDASAIEPDGTTTTPDDFACAKATAYVELLWATMYAGWDHWRDAPWSVVKNIQEAAGVDLKNNYVGLMIVAILDADATETDLHDIVENTPKAEAICRLAVKLDGTTAAMTDSDVERVIGMRDWLSTDALEWAYIDVCNDAIGRGNYDRAGRAACIDPAFTCVCPDPVEEIPAFHDWSFTYDFKLGAYNATTWAPYAGGTGNRQEAGVGWVSYPEGDKGWPVQIQIPAPKVATPGQVCRITYVKITYAEWGATGADFDVEWAQIFLDGSIHGMTLQQQPSHVWQGQTADIYDNKLILNRTNAWWMGNTGKKFVVSKILIAGTGEDRFSGLNPDGTMG